MILGTVFVLLMAPQRGMRYVKFSGDNLGKNVHFPSWVCALFPDVDNSLIIWFWDVVLDDCLGFRFCRRDGK